MCIKLLLLLFFPCYYFIRVPSTPDPSGETMVVNNKDFRRIMESAKIMSLEDKEQTERTKKMNINCRMDASNIRKKEMQELELSRRKNEKPSDLEQARLNNTGLSLTPMP